MGINDKLTEMLEAKQSQRATLQSAMVDAESKEERSAIRGTMDNLDNEIEGLRGIIAEMDEPVAPVAPAGAPEVVLGSQRMTHPADNSDLEYRKAFQRYIATGDRAILRDAAGNTTGADNVGTAIPQNLVNAIIEKIESVGTIYNLVTKTSYPVGQTIPRESIKPVATWVGVATQDSGEGKGSDVQKGVTLDTAISFTSFKLRCEVAMTEEVAVMALPVFEALFVKNVSIAMLRAIEGAIVSGDGKGQPTGILNGTAPEGQAIDVAAADELTYKTLCDADGALPARYEATAKWCMTKKTFMSFYGMVDSAGQPIARMNYGLNGKPERILLGRDVVIYEPQAKGKLGSYADTVEEDTVFAFIFDFGDYVLNNNYDLGIQHKIDWDNEDHRTKAVAAYDGKVIDNGSLVVLTKKNA